MIVTRFDCQAPRGDALSNTNASKKNGTLGNELERGIFRPQFPANDVPGSPRLLKGW